MSAIRISSITELHQVIGFPAPQHPLISLIDISKIQVTEEQVNIKVIYDFYMVSLKDKSCGMEYGRSNFDFDEGVMIFTAPGQVYTFTKPFKIGEIEGYMLFFHPDLIRDSHLGNQISDYSFFDYDVIEALHLSASEEKIIHKAISNIQKEYTQPVDNLSQKLTISNLELLLNYSLRFYERQFNTRTNESKDVIVQFERELKQYFKSHKHLEIGLPTVEYFSKRVHLSQQYFSDLIKKETGRNPKNHINEFIIEQAKDLLIRTEQSVGEIAHELGFNYPHYFARLFKSKVGYSPVQYRSLH